MKNRAKTCAGLLLFLCMNIVSPSYAQSDAGWTFQLSPSNGQINGTPGSTIGWGMVVTNNSPTNWLFGYFVATDSPFQHATFDTSVFYNPIVAPNSSVTIPYEGGSGLAATTWDANAPIGFSNSGIFTLSSYYYDGDPFNGGQYVSDAGSQTALYQANVVAPVPESSTFVSLGVGLLVLIGIVLIARKRSHKSAG